MTEFEKKLSKLTAEQSRELAAAMNAAYNEKLAEGEQNDDEEKAKNNNSEPK